MIYKYKYFSMKMDGNRICFITQRKTQLLLLGIRSTIFLSRILQWQEIEK